MNKSDLPQLAALIKQRTPIDAQIAALLNRPAERMHASRAIATLIFDIALENPASFTGQFRNGPLAGKTVSIKWNGKDEGVVDIKPESVPDYYLVMTGPRGTGGSSRGTTAPWVIVTVYLLDAPRLVADLQAQGVRLTESTKVPPATWHAAEIYPAHNSLLPLNEEQRMLLQLFSP